MGHVRCDRLKQWVRQERWLLLALAALFVARLPVGWHLTSQRVDFFLHDDGAEYVQLARSFARGEGLMKTAVQWYEAPRDQPIPEPYRPLLLSVLGGIFLIGNPESLFRLFVLQSLLYVGLIAMVKLMAARRWGPLAGWLAVALLLGHPLVAVWSFRFSTELLFTVLLLAIVWQWWRLGGWGSYAVLGLIVALATYARPTALLLVPIAAVALAWQLKRRQWGLIVVFGAFFTLGMTPQMIRNYVHFGVPKATTFYGGYAFWLGNNRDNLKAYRAGSGAEFLRWQESCFQEGIRLAKSLPPEMSLSPPRQDAYWFALAREEIAAMGLWSWAELLARRGWHFFRPWPLWGGHPPAVFWAVTCYELVLMGLGLAGLARQWRRDWRPLLPMGAVLACGASAHILVYVVMRYRVPFLDFPMILLAAGTLAAWVAPRLPASWRERAEPVAAQPVTEPN